MWREGGRIKVLEATGLLTVARYQPRTYCKRLCRADKNGKKNQVHTPWVLENKFASPREPNLRFLFLFLFFSVGLVIKLKSYVSWKNNNKYNYVS